MTNNEETLVSPLLNDYLEATMRAAHEEMNDISRAMSAPAVSGSAEETRALADAVRATFTVGDIITALRVQQESLAPVSTAQVAQLFVATMELVCAGDLLRRTTA